MAGISTETLRKYISNILKGADLNSLSVKKVRLQLEKELDENLLSRKQEIDDITMELITDSHKDDDAETDEHNDTESESDSESECEQPDDPPRKKAKANRKPATKKKGKSQSNQESDDSDLDDEALARKLQEEEVKSRSRAVKKTSNKKEKKEQKKTAAVKTKKETTYTRKCALSSELADVVGAEKMARHDVVKKMWEIVRERNLLDPKNKQFAICDDQLQKVFGAKRVKMFGMMKYLKNHIKDVK